MQQIKFNNLKEEFRGIMIAIYQQNGCRYFDCEQCGFRLPDGNCESIITDENGDLVYDDIPTSELAKEYIRQLRTL